MNPSFINQKNLLQQAIYHANVIEECECRIERGSHTDYYKGVLSEAITDYSDTIGLIIDSTIDIVSNHEAKKISSGLFAALNVITDEYKNNIPHA